jgi:hypothetical protein
MVLAPQARGQLSSLRQARIHPHLASTHSAYLKVPKGDEMEEPPTEGLISRTEAAGRRYQKCRNDGKRYCDG